jgi:ribulose 1,5-bisphosphate synthetase/thiazole synthase
MDGPRISPFFGGMLLSGERAAVLIAEAFNQIRTEANGKK